MKNTKRLSIFIILVLAVVWALPASAQLGDMDTSSFMIQNISETSVSVTIYFVSETGEVYAPSQLDSQSPTQLPNPFTLASADSQLIIGSDIPSDQLPPGQYSMAISSTAPVVAVTIVTGDVGGETPLHFTGGYTNFNSGTTTVFFSTVTFKYTNPPWYSMITVMNLGNEPADVQVTITCTAGSSAGQVGTLTRTGIPPKASYTWTLKDEPPDPPEVFNENAHCQGGAVVTSTNGQPIAAVNNNNVPTVGRDAAFEAVTSGATKLYVPQLNANYYNWVSSLNIRKLGTNNSTIATVDWSDGGDYSCPELTDSSPSCQIYVPGVHQQGVRVSAIITSSNDVKLIVSVGSSHSSGLSGGYNGTSIGSHSVALPLVMRNYDYWITAINCQNVSTEPTQLSIDYEDVGGVIDPYTHPTTIGEGESIQIVTTADGHLPDGYLGSAVITANADGAQISCMVGSSGPQTVTGGDYTLQYIGLPK